MDWFKKPTGYQCVTRQSDDTLFAYTGYTRDTYTLINFKWTKTYSYSSSSYQSYSGYSCLSDPYIIPNSTMTAFLFPASLFVLAFFSVISRIFRRRYA